MPNWTRNVLIMENIGLEPLFNVDERGSIFFDFERIIPMPESEKENWYNWRWVNWGTKSPAFKTIIESPHCVIFNTAWDAPIPVVCELSKRFPDNYILLISSYESNPDLDTLVVFKNGIMSDNIELDRHADTWCRDENYNSTMEYYIDWAAGEFLVDVEGATVVEVNLEGEIHKKLQLPESKVYKSQEL